MPAASGCLVFAIVAAAGTEDPGRQDSGAEPAPTGSAATEAEPAANGAPVVVEPALPAPGARRRRLGRYDAEGSASVGWLFFDPDGDRAQAREDLNPDRGPQLRDLVLEAEAVEPGEGPEAFGLRVLGLGANDSSLRSSADFGALSIASTYDRSRWRATSDSDLHPFDVERQRASLTLEHSRRSGALRRAGLDLSWGQRDGFVLGSQAVNFTFVDDVPVRQVERSLGAGAQLVLALGPWRLDFQAGIEGLDARDRRSFSAPDPNEPSFTLSEDFAADQDGRAQRIGARLERDLSAEVSLEAGLAWRAARHTGELALSEVGNFNDPSLPFLRDTAADSELETRDFEGELGATFRLDEETELELGVLHEHESEVGELVQTVTLDEMMGGPPSMSTFVDTVDHASDLDLLRASLWRALGERADLELHGEVGRAEIDVLQVGDGTTLRAFDGSERVAGARAEVGVETGAHSELELSAGWGVHPTETSKLGVFFDFDPTTQRSLAASWRWRGSDQATLDLRLSREDRSAQAFGLRSIVDAASIALARRLGERWRVDASLGLRSFERESDTTYLSIGPGGISVVPGVAEFEGEQLILSGGFDLELTAAVHPRLRASLVSGGGDASYDLARVDLGLPWRIRPGLEVGAELGWTRLTGDEALQASDYEAGIAFVYLRVGALP
jgi:hypothetical protein